MDNDFQYPIAQRAEREEYRSKFKFADEDKPSKRGAKKSREKTKTDYLINLILLQGVLCILIVAGVFIASKVSPAAYQRMKNDYGRIMSENMSAGDVIDKLRGAADFVFKPVDMGQDTDATLDDELQQDNPQETLPAQAVPSLSEEYDVSSYEVTSDETGETVAVGEIVQNGSGGGDIEKQEATKGTSFSPYYVSVDPVLPVKNARITSRFGYRTNPISGNYGFHTGLDLAAEEGTPVAAAFYGKIAKIGESDVWGKYILIEHSDSFSTYYCHLSEIYVEQGAVIRQGETIGLVGSTGWSTGPHLHFEVRINGIRVNPELLLYPENGDEA